MYLRIYIIFHFWYFYYWYFITKFLIFEKYRIYPIFASIPNVPAGSSFVSISLYLSSN